MYVLDSSDFRMRPFVYQLVLHGSRGNEINRLVTETLSLLTIVVACPLWFLFDVGRMRDSAGCRFLHDFAVSVNAS